MGHSNGNGLVRVLHLPCNTPYIRKLQRDGVFVIANHDVASRCDLRSSEPTFSFIVGNASRDEFWQMFDVCHIHYGFEFEDLEVVVLALRLLKMRSKPVVYTCHELESVHGVSVQRYRDYQHAILESSDAVITLTPGCAAALQESFGGSMSVKVIPHGYVIPPGHPNFGGIAGRRVDELLLIGGLRQNRDYVTPLVNLGLSIGSQFKVTWLTRPFTHEQLADPANLSLLVAAIQNEKLQIATSLPMEDDELWSRTAIADVLLLPYRFAGHSGQLELAFDCGLLPVATDVGFLRQQTGAWPGTGPVPNAVWCDWSDGREWLYQIRLMTAVRESVKHFHDFASALDIPSRKAFRASEHEGILNEHWNTYSSLLAP